MFSYFAYGLGIKSVLPIPEFIPAQVRCDVTIEVEKDRSPREYLPLEVVSEAMALKLSQEEAIVYWQDVGVFLVQGGKKIIIIPVADISENLIRLFLVGSIMAILLYQRGLLVLHASVVNINSSAVAFLGVSGEGKSSTAAALHAYGHGLIADDVAAITLGKEQVTITPGFPQIKVSLEVANCLGYDSSSLHLLHPNLKKLGLRHTQDFYQKPLPIKRIYVLTDHAEFGIEPLKLQEALIELSRHSRLTTLFRFETATHFLQCVTLAKECTIYRLKRPRDLSLLPKLVKLVEEDVLSSK